MMKRHHQTKTAALQPLDWLPSPPEYERSPELGVLAILLSILDVVYIALLAANRDLLDDDRPHWSPLGPTAPAADTILRQIDRLRRSVAAYQHAALPPPPDTSPLADDDIPF
jgi:hypothetical protein